MTAAVLSREEWLAERRNYIGASDAAAILGADPRRGALAVYESKITGHSSDDNAWMKYGRDIEGAIAKMYASVTGRVVVDLGATAIQVHPDIPFIGATLDRVAWKDREAYMEFSTVPAVQDDSAPLELKSIDPYGAKIRADEFKEEPLLHMQIQLMIQMACTGASWGSLAGLFPGYNLAWLDIDRDDAFLAAAYPVLDEFWQRVQRKEPPPPDSHKDLEIVKRLWPQADGETVELDADKILIVDAWEKAKMIKGEADKDAKSLEATIRAVIGDATFGQLPDGRMVSLKTTFRKAYTREVAAGEYRTLRMMKLKGK